MFLMAFGFFTTLVYHGPWYLWVIGFICAVFAPRWALMIFGIVISIILHVPVIIWIAGFLCVCADLVITALLSD